MAGLINQTNPNMMGVNQPLPAIDPQRLTSVPPTPLPTVQPTAGLPSALPTALPTAGLPTTQPAAGAQPVPPVTAPPAGVASPTLWGATRQQTVAGQMAGLLQANNPLQQQAITQANQEMNARGLLNSSMAVGAAREAQNRAALPIAQQDAATAAERERFNVEQANLASTREDVQSFDITRLGVEARNTLRQMSVAQQNELARMAVEQGLNLETMDAAQINELERMRVDTVNRGRLARIEGQNRIDITNLQTENQQLLATNQTASDLYGTVLANISAIQSNPDIDGVTITATGKTAKQNAIDQQMALLQGGLTLVGGVTGMPELSSLLGFGETPGAPGSLENLGTPGTLQGTPEEQAAAGSTAVESAAGAASATPAPGTAAGAAAGIEQAGQAQNAANDLAARQAAWDQAYANARADNQQWGNPMPDLGPRPTA